MEGGQERGRETFENIQGVKPVKSEHEVEAVVYIANRHSRGELTTVERCLWQGSLGNTDRLCFLMTLLLVMLCIIAIIIVLSCRQGYN